MSTSLMYHAFGLKGYHYEKTEYCFGEIHFYIRQPAQRIRCPLCQSLGVIRKGFKERQWRSLPIGKKPVKLHLKIPRIFCSACQITRQVGVSFARKKQSYTHAFERYVLELLQYMTIQDVSRHLKLEWNTVKSIEKRYLKKHFSSPNLKDLRQIAIDEISIGKGHRYLTLVLDLQSGAVVYVGQGKEGKALDKFWKRLKNSGAKIEAVATDMSPAFSKAIDDNLSEALHVFDHFHVIKLFNDKIDKLRRSLQRKASEEEKEVIKGTRWLLLKRPDSLNEEKDEQQRLQEALALNEPLAIAYYLKEDLRSLWSKNNKTQASHFLQDWIAAAFTSKIKFLKSFAKTLNKHSKKILAYYDIPISTGPLEGTNNKIKTLQKKAYGYRDEEFFKLKIMALHRSRYALIG